MRTFLLSMFMILAFWGRAKNTVVPIFDGGVVHTDLTNNIRGNKFFIVDSICQELNVPYDLVVEIGYNESNWKWVIGTYNDVGYLQVIPKTFNYWYQELSLSGGHNERNNIIVGVTYLRYNYDRYRSWRKARFAYGRGHWRGPHTWTSMERKFMNKINWKKYDC